VAIFGEKDSHAVYYLHQQGITRLDVVNYIAHGIKKSDPPEPAKPATSPSWSTATSFGACSTPPSSRSTTNPYRLG